MLPLLAKLITILINHISFIKTKSENNKHQCLLKFTSHVITTSILEAASLTQRISHVFNVYNDINLTIAATSSSEETGFFRGNAENQLIIEPLKNLTSNYVLQIFLFSSHTQCFIHQLHNSLVPLDSWVHELASLQWGDNRSEMIRKPDTPWLTYTFQIKFRTNSTCGSSMAIRPRKRRNLKAHFLPSSKCLYVYHGLF